MNNEQTARIACNTCGVVQKATLYEPDVGSDLIPTEWATKDTCAVCDAPLQLSKRQRMRI